MKLLLKQLNRQHYRLRIRVNAKTPAHVCSDIRCSSELSYTIYADPEFLGHGISALHGARFLDQYFEPTGVEKECLAGVEGVTGSNSNLLKMGRIA